MLSNSVLLQVRKILRNYSKFSALIWLIDKMGHRDKNVNVSNKSLKKNNLISVHVTMLFCNFIYWYKVMLL